MHTFLRLLTIVSVATFSSSATASEQEFDGYSYAMLVGESLTHTEFVSALPVTAKATSNNMALIAGGLYRINERLDFSIETSTSYLAGNATEDWDIDTGTAGDAYRANPCTGCLPLPANAVTVQSNDVQMSHSAIQGLLHVKHTDQWRSIYGANWNAFNFSRFAWNSAYAQTPPAATDPIKLPNGSVEESQYELLATLGLAYESRPLAIATSRWHGKAMLHVPLWRQVTNTGRPELVFSNTSGWAAEVQGSYNRRIYESLEVSLYAAWRGSTRSKREIQLANDGKYYELPKADAHQLSAGVGLAWNFSRKRK